MGDLKLAYLIAAKFKTSSFWWAVGDSDLSRLGKPLPCSFLALSITLVSSLIHVLEK